MKYPPLACCLGFIGKESCSRTADVCEKGSQWQQTLELFDRVLGETAHSNSLTYIAPNSACEEGWLCRRPFCTLEVRWEVRFNDVLSLAGLFSELVKKTLRVYMCSCV